jgi:uncharacterized protein (UPF0332 family)
MNLEIQKLVDRAEDFYQDSQYLLEGKRYEAVVNRSYYAMFTMVQALLFTKNIFSKTHQGTQLKFHELFIKPGLIPKELGKILNETYEKRQFSDYDMDAEISMAEAEKVHKNTRFLLDAIKYYLDTVA